MSSSSQVTRRAALGYLGAAAAAAPALAAPQEPKKPREPREPKPAKPAPTAPKPGEGDSTGGYASNGMPTIETGAMFALVIDADTGFTMLDKNADQRMYPASMTKMMTAHIIFEKLKRNELRMEDEFSVSENAWRKGGSKMFIEVGSRVKLSDLLRGIVISSGNDACIAVAEGIAGSEESFADLMNKKARDLGMTNSQFRNPTGWPDPNHWTTCRDLAILAKSTIEHYPEYYSIYAEREFTYNNIRQANRNPLLSENLGADGLKTGHTDEAGFSLTGSAVRDGRRVIIVINGLRSMKERSVESKRLTDWAFREFDTVAVFKAGDVIDEAGVALGEAKTVPLITPNTVKVTLPRRSKSELKVTLRYNAPLSAPVAYGQAVGTLVATAPAIQPREIPVVAGASVAALGFFGRIGARLSAKFGG